MHSSAPKRAGNGRRFRAKSTLPLMPRGKTLRGGIHPAPRAVETWTFAHAFDRLKQCLGHIAMADLLPPGGAQAWPASSFRHRRTIFANTGGGRQQGYFISLINRYFGKEDISILSAAGGVASLHACEVLSSPLPRRTSALWGCPPEAAAGHSALLFEG